MSLKKYLPYESYILTTKLSVAEVEQRLAKRIEPRRKFRAFAMFRNNAMPYEGMISGRQFIINRIIHYNNSFIPKITGRISSGVGKTQIEIKMDLFRSVIIFMLLLLTASVIAGCIALVIPIVDHRLLLNKNLSPIALLPLFFVIFFGVACIAFKFESQKSKVFLANLFEATEI